MPAPSSPRVGDQRPGGRAARVRAAVLAATTELLDEHGYDGFTYDDVAARAGVHKTTVYRRWPVKPELVADALDLYSEAHVPIPDTGSLHEDLVELGASVAASIFSASGARRSVSIVAAAADSDEVAGAVHSFMQRRIALAEPIVDRAIARGELPGGVDARLVIESVVGPLWFRLLLTGDASDGDVAAAVADLIARGATALRSPPATFVDAPPPVSLPVATSNERFPVHRVFCVGRNYADHAVEMGHDPEREPPFFFEKSPACVLRPGEAFAYPPRTAEVHHEIELVVAIGTGGASIRPEAALEHVAGYAVGLDMTRRDLQSAAKDAGRPWSVGKSFDGAAPMSPVVPADHGGHPTSGAIALDVNGRPRQRGDLDQMIWSPAEIVAELSSYVRLAPGDLIMTGTPAGVGPVEPGDRLHGWIDGVADVDIAVTAPTPLGDTY